jgi:hypothetical protein
MPRKEQVVAADNRKAEEEERQAITEALDWMQATNKGVKAAIATKKWPNLQRGKLDYAKKLAVKGCVQQALVERHAGSMLLTRLEEAELCGWLKEKNLRLDGQDNDQIEEKVLIILKARKAVLRAVKGRKGTKLSTAASQALQRRAISPTWFQSFYKRNADILKKGAPGTVDEKRAKKATFANAKLNLTEGSHSLYRELTELPGRDGKPTIGTIHPETGRPIRPIIDPATGEFTKADPAIPGSSDGRRRLLQIRQQRQRRQRRRQQWTRWRRRLRP